MTDFITEQTPFGTSRARAYDPSRGHAQRERGEDDTSAGLSSLGADSVGDWSWKPHRYEQDPGHKLTDAEILALYPDRVYVPNARVSCG